MRKLSGLMLFACLMMAGCIGVESESTDAYPPTPKADGATATKEAATKEAATKEAGTGEVGTGEAGGEKEMAAAENFALKAENTSIKFVGLHKGDDPKPRHGTFETFTGSVASADGKLTSLAVEIQTDSIKIEPEASGLDEAGAGKLVGHLSSPDFFNVKQFPAASFKSDSFETAADGTVTVKGKLTMLGEAQDISFPAKVSLDGGLSIEGTFKIDRTKFGMIFGLETIEEEVEMTIKVSPQGV